MIAAELFRRYTDDGASIADLTRWLTSENVPTRTGKARWDRSVVWGMLRNPAYAGTAVFGKTQVLQESPGLNRRARLEGRSVPRASKTVDRPREEWIEIPVPAIVTAGTFEPGRPAARRQQALRRPQHQGPLPAAGPGRLLGLRIRLLPHLDPDHEQEDLLLPVPGQRRLPLRRRPGLRQQAGPRRLPRHRRLGPHHRPARRPGADPRRDHQAARAGPHRRPGHPAAQAAGAGPGQGRHRDHRDDRGVLRAADHHR